MKQKHIWILLLAGIVVLLIAGFWESVLAALGMILSLIIWIIPPALLIWAATYWGRGDQRRGLWRNAQKEASVQKLLHRFGDAPQAQVARINELFDERKESLAFSFDYVGTEVGRRITANYERALSAMPPREREALRTALLLKATGHHRSDTNTWKQIAVLLYAEGKSVVYEGWTYTWHGHDTSDIHDGIATILKGDGIEAMVNLIIAELNDALAEHPDDPLLKTLAARLLGTGSDIDLPAGLIPIDADRPPAHALILGGGPDANSPLYGYAGEGHLITVAPSRSGKSQCHVIPNLLTWDGPAVVLDVKNELFEKTSGWRAANVGPVIKFSPLTPESSHRYNPITEVSEDPDHLWEDSRFLADMLIVPTSAKDPFWEKRARDILTAAIAYVVHHNPPDERGVDKVLDIIHGLGWERFLAGLSVAELPTMVRAARSLGEMEPRVKDGVLQTALSSLSAWEGNRISQTTAVSDWRPADLREGKPTIYICLRPNEVDSYISVLRVLIAQHIRTLIGGTAGRDPRQVLFLLDELPRLRHMPPVEEALDTGAQYGIKLWMFIQTMSQLEAAYEKKAEGMIAGCAVRSYMNPGMDDGLAQKLSDQLGHRDSILDGSRQKIAEPTVLAGPEFAQRILVMATGAKPGVVEKRPAHGEAHFSERMGIPPAPLVRRNDA